MVGLVGQLHFGEGDRIFHPCLAIIGRIRMLVWRPVDGRIRLGSRLPLATDVAPTMRIDLFEGQFDGVHLLRFQTTNADGDDGKHPTASFSHSESKRRCRLRRQRATRAYIISLVST